MARHDGRNRAAAAGGEIDARGARHERRAVDRVGKCAAHPFVGHQLEAGVEPEERRRERRRAVGDGVGSGNRSVAHELEVVASGEPIAERRLLAALGERDSHLADVAGARGPVGIRRQQRAHLVHLGEHVRPVADERLGPPPGRPDLVRAVARPRIGPVRREHVGEVVARLAQVHLERPVVERLGRLDVVQQERRDVSLLAQLAPGVDEVLGRERVPIAPAGVLAQHEQVREAVGRDVHVLRQLGHDVEVVVDAQEAAEQLLDHDRGVALMARYQLSYTVIELGDGERGRTMREDILRRARASGDEAIEALALGGLIRFPLAEERFEDALELLGASIRIQARLGNLNRVALLLGRVAYPLAHLGRAETAARLLAYSLVLFEQIGQKIPWTAAENEETFASIRGQLSEDARSTRPGRQARS